MGKRTSKRTSKRKPNTWIRALKKAGYAKKGSEILIPKKGSVEYKKVKAIQKTLR